MSLVRFMTKLMMALATSMIDCKFRRFFLPVYLGTYIGTYLNP